MSSIVAASFLRRITNIAEERISTFLRDIPINYLDEYIRNDLVALRDPNQCQEVFCPTTVYVRSGKRRRCCHAISLHLHYDSRRRGVGQ
jgi:hypothetical protein